MISVSYGSDPEMLMAKGKPIQPIFLKWSSQLPAGDVQDPLGLGLRGSTRLASRLLFCITSITPRARYFSFIPWCIHDWQKREKGNKHPYSLREAITLREKALTLSCIAHHDGHPCEGGALVGSVKARRWFQKGEDVADLAKLSFSKNPALGAYFNSLVNLGTFTTENEQVEDSDEERQESDITFDDIELSPLGKSLAEAYGERIDNLKATLTLAGPARRVQLADLKRIGKRGGLCELKEAASTDRPLLRNLFFAKDADKNNSHWMRRNTLLLILEVCKKLNEGNWLFDSAAFADIAYFGHVTTDEGGVYPVNLSPHLEDVALRWRQFYFHHYMSVALEGIFSWAVTQAFQCGIAGISIDSLAAQLNNKALKKNLRENLSIDLPDQLGRLTPGDVFSGYVSADILTAESSKQLDRLVGSSSNLPSKPEATVAHQIANKTALDSSGTLLATIVAESGGQRFESSPYWIVQEGRLTYEPGESQASSENKIVETGEGLAEFIDDLGKREGVNAVIEYLRHLNIRYEDGIVGGGGLRPFKLKMHDPYRPDEAPKWLLEAHINTEDLAEAIYEFTDRHEHRRLLRHVARGNINGIGNYLDILTSLTRLLSIYHARNVITWQQVLKRLLKYVQLSTGGAASEEDTFGGYLLAVVENLGSDLDLIQKVCNETNFLAEVRAVLWLAQYLRFTGSKGREGLRVRDMLPSHVRSFNNFLQTHGFDKPTKESVRNSLHRYNMLPPYELGMMGN